MGLAHAVITCVARDDLADGGAGGFAATIAAIRQPHAPDDRRGAHLGLQGRRGIARAPCSTPGPTSSTTTSRRWPGCSGRSARRPATPGAWPCWPGPRTPGSPPSRGSSSAWASGGRGAGHPGRPAGGGGRHRHRRPVPASERPTICRWPGGGRPRSSTPFGDAGMAMGFAHVQASPLTRSSYHAREAAEASAAAGRPTPAGPGPDRAVAAGRGPGGHGDRAVGHGPWPRAATRIEPGAPAHGRARGGRPAALPRGRSALADRLPGHAPRAADHAGPARGRASRPGRPRPGGAPGGRGRRPVLPAAVDRHRGPARSGHLAAAGPVPAPAAHSALAISDRAWATTLLGLQRRLPAARLDRGLDGHLADPGRQGRRGARRPAGWPVPPPTGWPPCCRPGRSRSSGSTEAEVSGPSRRAAGRRGPPAGQLRHRGQRPQRRQSRTTSPADGSSGAGETVVCDFGGAYSLDGDVGYCSDITRTVVTGPAVRRDRRSATTCCWRPSRRAVVVGPGRRDRRARRPRGPAGHRGRRLRRPLRPPDRSRDRHRGARGPLPGGRERRAPPTRARLLGGAGHLLARALRHAARGHRGHRRGRRARAAQHRRSRAWSWWTGEGTLGGPGHRGAGGAGGGRLPRTGPGHGRGAGRRGGAGDDLLARRRLPGRGGGEPAGRRGRGGHPRRRHHRSGRARPNWSRPRCEAFGTVDIVVANAGGPPAGPCPGGRRRR